MHGGRGAEPVPSGSWRMAGAPAGDGHKHPAPTARPSRAPIGDDDVQCGVQRRRAPLSPHSPTLSPLASASGLVPASPPASQLPPPSPLRHHARLSMPPCSTAALPFSCVSAAASLPQYRWPAVDLLAPATSSPSSADLPSAERRVREREIGEGEGEGEEKRGRERLAY